MRRLRRSPCRRPLSVFVFLPSSFPTPHFRVLRRCAPCRQAHPKSRADSGLALDLDTPTHFRNDLLRNMQSQARALRPLDALPLDAEELAEKKRPVLFRDTDARVGDGNRHLAAGETPGNSGLSTRLVVLDGIRDQVVKQNIQAVPVARYAQRFFRPNGFERKLLGPPHLLVGAPS